MRMALILAVVALAAAADEKKEEASAKATEKASVDAGAGGIWDRLVGTDYVDRNRSDLGTGLRFFEEKGEKKCRVVTFGSGKPVCGDRVVPVALEGNRLRIGETDDGAWVYQVDPALLALTPELEGAKPILPDRFKLRSVLRCLDEISRRRVP